MLHNSNIVNFMVIKYNNLYIYLNINQLDALNFMMSLFHAPTCSKHTCSSSGGQKLYYTCRGMK